MTLQEYVDSIKPQSIAVVGIGISNLPLIELLLSNGCDVTACDLRSREQLQEKAVHLESMGAKLKLGPDYLNDLHQELIFRTPGLMPFDPHLEEAKRHGALITSEMEVFMQLCPCRMIAVTGSDGKTTTSTILSELLKAAGYKTHLGGNIGHPLLCEIPDIEPDDFVVLELSSFQLHSMKCCPDIAVITNLSPNHLDKHRDFQDYMDAKRRVLENQTENCRLILNQDDAYSAYYASYSKANISWFSGRSTVKAGAYQSNRILYRIRNDVSRVILPASEIRIPGDHNVLNYLAAFAAVEDFVNDEKCAQVARSFAGVEHRLEIVRVLDGITYINDSIGTSPTRTIAGLRAMKTRPILIAGGYDKHIPFDNLGDAICNMAKELYLSGNTASKISDAVRHSPSFKEHPIGIHIEGDFKEAVMAASKAAHAGDIVLLSPACAAFDQFSNFAERGKAFKAIVNSL